MTTRIRDTWVAVGLETVPGTAVTSADMRVLDADFTTPGLEITKPLRDNATSRHGLPGLPALAATAATVELVVPVDIASAVRTSASDPISPPPYDVLLQSCGFERADSTADRTATYSLGGVSSCTIEWRAGARRFRMVGCRGTFAMAADAGGDLTFTFTMQGRAEVVHVATSAQRPADATSAYRRCRSFGATVDLAEVNVDGTAGNAIALDEALVGVGMDMGLVLARPGDVTAPDGNALPVITAARPTQELNMIAPDLTGTSADPFWALAAGDGYLRVAATFQSPDAEATMQTILGSASATSAEVSDTDGIVGQQITASGVDLAPEPVQLVFTTPTV